LNTHNNIPFELAPCGVFCGACPAFGKTCKGCPSEDKAQSRKSKWGCKIRNCCYSEIGLDYCIDCSDFPCKVYRKKLLETHEHEDRYIYRYEIPEIFPKIKEMSIGDYIAFHKKRWKCDSCEGTIRFYHYTCDSCGKEKFVN